MTQKFERGVREGEIGLPLSNKFSACLSLQPDLRGECKLTWCGRGCSKLGQCISPFIPTDTTVGGTPHGGELPAQELKLSDDFHRPSCLLMVMLVEVECVHCSPVVNADKYRRV